MSLYARLQPGVTIQQATDRLSALLAPDKLKDGSLRPVKARVMSRMGAAIDSARTTVQVLIATIALLVPTVLIFGLVPALRLSRIRLTSALTGGRHTGSSLTRRGGQLLIAGEVALAIVLVTGAALMLRSFVRLSATDLGFDPDDLVTMELLPLDREPGAHNAYYPALLQRVRTLPGIRSAGLVDNFPLGSGTTFTGIRGTADVGTSIFRTLPGYFETIGARLRAGRFPSDADYGPEFRGVVINEAAARALFPDGPAVGRQVTRSGKDQTPWTVFGVIADLRHGGPLGNRSENYPQVFFPLDVTADDLVQPMIVVIRTASGAGAVGDRLRQTAQSIGPRVLVERILTANDRFGQGVITPRRRTVLLGLLGAFGLILALVGVFGMTGYAVSRRTAEIGIRMAFGAQPGQVVRTILRDAMIPIAIGTVAGLGAATLVARLIESFLFKTAPTDVLSYVTVAALLMATGLIAALIPARRAARVDPIETLRAQ